MSAPGAVRVKANTVGSPVAGPSGNTSVEYSVSVWGTVLPIGRGGARLSSEDLVHVGFDGVADMARFQRGSGAGRHPGRFELQLMLVA